MVNADESITNKKVILCLKQSQLIANLLGSNWRVDVRGVENHTSSLRIDNIKNKSRILIVWGYGYKDNKVKLSAYCLNNQFNEIGLSFDKRPELIIKDIKRRLLVGFDDFCSEQIEKEKNVKTENDDYQYRIEAFKKAYTGNFRENSYQREFYGCIYPRNYIVPWDTVCHGRAKVYIGLNPNTKHVDIMVGDANETLAFEIMSLVKKHHDMEVSR